MNEGQVILVDATDTPVGLAEKMEAHRKGWLHRAFSIFIFNKNGEMLLQQRALHKYHSGGLWTNACCSHPFPDETIMEAARRRLWEEMGFFAPLEKIFDFTYRAEVGNDLIENEFDHVLCGEYEGSIVYNKDEVMNCRYFSLGEIGTLLREEPSKFTEWFRIAFPMVIDWRREALAPKAEERN